MKSSRVLIRAKGRGLCIERGLHDCLQKELFTDVSLNYVGGKIRANKGVLAAASPVFSRLLKDWPIVEEPCIIMAGYMAEEVQGLIKYIYTGQLSAPIAKETSWQKMIEDFEIGVEPVDESYCVDEWNSIDGSGKEVLEKVRSPEKSPSERLPKLTLPKISKKSKSAGPKIVSVTSPRPLIVKVQSSTTTQSTANGDELAKPEMENDIASDEANCDDSLIAGSSPQKKSRKTPKLLLGKQLAGPAVLTSVLKNPVAKQEKEFRTSPSKKRFVCPYCQRRFLTRGNVKNHIRIHTRERPFSCVICRDIFTYLGVYQRHLLKHREANDITEEEFQRLISEAMQSAAEHTSSFDESSIRIDETEQLLGLPSGGECADRTSKLESTGVAGKLADEPEEEESVDIASDEPFEKLSSAEAEPAEQLPEELKKEETEKLTEEPPADQTEEPMEDDSTTDYLIADEEMIIASKFASKAELDEDNKSGEDLSERGQVEIVEGNATKQLAEASNDASNGEQKNIEEDGANLKIIQCDLCPRKFGKWSALYVHRCTHTGDVPVIHCSVCNEHFSSIEALKEHKKTHGQDRAFHCEKCNKKFTSNRALKAHTLVHTFRLTVKCRFCPKVMRNVRERQAHERKHRSKKLHEAAEPAADAADVAEATEAAAETAESAGEADESVAPAPELTEVTQDAHEAQASDEAIITPASESQVDEKKNL